MTMNRLARRALLAPPYSAIRRPLEGSTPERGPEWRTIPGTVIGEGGRIVSNLNRIYGPGMLSWGFFGV